MKPEAFYQQVKGRFSILITKYGFEPIFELLPGGSFGFSKIIFQSETGRIQFNIEQRDQTFDILLAFGISTEEEYDEETYDYGEWYNIAHILNGLGIKVDYRRLYGELNEKDWDTIINRLLENWAQELYPHWDKIVAGLKDPSFRQKVDSLKEKGQLQKIRYYKSYNWFRELLGWLLSNIPIGIGYLACALIGLLLVAQLGKWLPKNFNSDVLFIVAIGPPYLFYVTLKYLKRSKEQTESDVLEESEIEQATRDVEEAQARGMPEDIAHAILALDESPITAWRKYRGITRSQLAEAVGISKSHLIQIETGKRTASPDVLERIAKALDVSLEEIISADKYRRRR